MKSISKVDFYTKFKIIITVPFVVVHTSYIFQCFQKYAPEKLPSKEQVSNS